MASAQMDNMYPEIYQELYPMVAQAVDDMMRRGYTPTPDMIASIVDQIIKRSGMWDEDDDMDDSMEAIPAQLGFGGQSFRRGRGRRRHHNRNTLRDIVRILLLRELFGRRGSFPRQW